MPQVKHQYARNTFRCELISITNRVKNNIDYEGILDKIQTHSLHGYSLYIKINVLTNMDMNAILLTAIPVHDSMTYIQMRIDKLAINNYIISKNICFSYECLICIDLVNMSIDSFF